MRVDITNTNKKYNIIYADPPWSYKSRRSLYIDNKSGETLSHYATLSPEEIKSLPVSEITADRAMLFLWCTFPQLPIGLEVIKSWGFEYKTIAFCWIKTQKDGQTPAFGVGYYTRCLGKNSIVTVFDQDENKIKRVSLEQLYKIYKEGKFRIHTPSGWKNIFEVKKTTAKVVKIKNPLNSIVCSYNHKLFYKTIHQFIVKKGTNKRKTKFVIECDTVEQIKYKKNRKMERSYGSTTLLFSATPIEHISCLTKIQEIKLDETLAWMIGLFCAEGNYYKNQIRYTLHKKESHFYEKIKDKIQQLNLQQDRYFNYKVKVNLFNCKDANWMAVYFSSKKIKDIYKQFILNEGAHFKRLNLDLLLQTSVCFRKSFIQGMLDGDGYLEHGKYIRLGLCNENLIDDFRILFHSVGIPTSKRVGWSTTTYGKKTNIYTLSVYHRSKKYKFVDNTSANTIQIDNFVDIGIRDTFDLVVEGGIFVVNDIISHNSNAEPCLLAVKGKAFKQRSDISSIVMSPREEHSKKPDIVADKIVQLCGDLSRIELFSRKRRNGWDSWGDQLKCR